tara:strand:+ start:1556 stop:2833 length:1278 start_codon:yes stop_codon:yes gene_type:complete
MQGQISANRPQAQFLQIEKKFKAFVGGFGSGKTYAGLIDQAIHFVEKPKVNQGYFAPNYGQIRDIFFPTAEEVASGMGLKVDIKVSDKEVHWYNGRNYIGTTICRSMDNPSSIVGFKIGKALIDEIDIMNTEKATLAWRKIIARLRWADKRNWVDASNGAAVTTTPEGFKFVHKQFVEHVEKKGKHSYYGIVHASTYENENNLPDDYIDSLFETYPPELIAAYIDGQFTNLTSGTVYRNFNRVANGSHEEIKEREPLYIGQDFNVNHMASCIFVKRGNGYHCVAELVDGIDTPSLIKTIEDKYPEHKIYMYPDASGKNTSSKGASISDIGLLKAAKFNIKAKNQNPFIKDRVLSVNTAFTKQKIWVNAKNCPETTKCLEQQAYDKNGEPDKKSGVDHQNDGFGYFCHYEMPVNKPTIEVGFMAMG